MRHIDKFFAYARERHNVWLRRTAGEPRPWTDDPILQRYRFCNVFRELDKTTEWFRRHVRDPLKDRDEVLLATVVFRMLNRIEVGEAVFCQLDTSGRSAFELFADTSDSRHLYRAIKAYCGPKGPYTTGAYIISTPPGYTKLKGVLKILENFSRGRFAFPAESVGNIDWRDAAAILRNSADVVGLEGAWRWLREVPYLGAFHSYEIVTDLRFTCMLDKAHDINSWANMGPGARRGLNRIFGRVADKNGRNAWGSSIPTQQALDEMREILRLSRDAKYWPQGNKRMLGGPQRGKMWPRWELRDVEHTLCEFDKYSRVLNGEGAPRGVYR